MNSRKALIIFSGYNSRAVIALCRLFYKNDLPFFIVAASDEDSIMHTNYKEKVQWVRKNVSLEVNELINSVSYIIKKFDLLEVTIVPSTEALNHFLLLHREILEKNNIHVPLVNQQLYGQITNKYSFGQLCKQKGISVPCELKITEIDSFPVVAKPIKYSLDKDSISPVIIGSESQFNIFKESDRKDEYYFQEYIEGDSYYLFYSFDKKGGCETFSQQNLIQQGNGKSIVLAVASMIHLEKIGESFANLFKDLEYFGVVMVEIKRFKGTDYMIEANPRFWGPLQLIVDCNIPIIEHWVRMNGFEVPANVKEKKFESYLWLAGLTRSLRKDQIMYHVSELILDDLPYYLNKDIYLREDSYKYFIEEMKGVHSNE